MENHYLIIFGQHDVDLSKVSALKTCHDALHCILGENGTVPPVCYYERWVNIV